MRTITDASNTCYTSEGCRRYVHSNDVIRKKTISKTGMSYLNSPTTELYGTLNLWVTRYLYLPVIAKYTVDIHRGDRSELSLYFSCVYCMYVLIVRSKVLRFKFHTTV